MIFSNKKATFLANKWSEKYIQSTFKKTNTNIEVPFEPVKYKNAFMKPIVKHYIAVRTDVGPQPFMSGVCFVVFGLCY